MRKQCLLVILILSAISFGSTSLFAHDQAQGNPAQQGGGAPRQMRGPAPPVPGPPHDPHDLTGVWNGRRGYGGSTYSGQGPELTEWGKQNSAWPKLPTVVSTRSTRQTIRSSPNVCRR